MTPVQVDPMSAATSCAASTSGTSKLRAGLQATNKTASEAKRIDLEVFTRIPPGRQ
jgi:hypothetical protein